MRDVDKLKGAELRAHAKLTSGEFNFYFLADYTDFDYVEPGEFRPALRKALRASNRLNRELMRYDAAFHPHPEWFEEWKDNYGSHWCPYLRIPTGSHYNLATRVFEEFEPVKALYTPGRALSAVKLLKLVRQVKAMRKRVRLFV